MVPIQNTPKGVPVELVIQLKQQGLTNNQIIQQLEKQGYEYYDIYDAITQSTLKSNVPINTLRGENKMDNNQIARPPQMPPQPRMNINTQPQQNAIETKQFIEEIAEAIIDEKWKMILDSMNKILDWKDKVDERIIKIENNIERMQSDFDKLHESIMGRIQGYDKTMSDVGTELKSMEMVFKKALPGFVENVNELSRIAENLKEIKKK